MVRKQILPRPPVESTSFEAGIPVAEVATVQVTSEQGNHPIDNVFDNRQGPGGSRWIADGPGEQTLILVFDSPQTIRKVSLEVEELWVSRTQELSVSVSSDGARTIESSCDRNLRSAHQARVSSERYGQSRPKV